MTIRAEGRATLTDAERKHLKQQCAPGFWGDVGLEVLGHLVRDSRRKLIHPKRQKPFNTLDLEAYIWEATKIRGFPYNVSDSSINTLENNSAHPKHNTIIGVAAAQFIRHPLTEALLSEADILLVASGLYNPYLETEPVSAPFSGYVNLSKNAMPLLDCFTVGAGMEKTRMGMIQLAAVLKAARIERAISIDDLCAEVEAATGIIIPLEQLESLERGVREIASDVLMALTAYEYAINPATDKPYTIQEMLCVLNERLLPLNPRSKEPFSAANLKFLEIEPSL